MRTPIAFVVSVLLVQGLIGQGRGFPYDMDFGPCLTTTFAGGGLGGTTEKGLVIRLGDERAGCWGAVAFDTQLLRMSAVWTDGWLRLRGTAYDGSHGPFPLRRGQVLAETREGPGWARAGSLADPRSISHGPLPRAWGQYGGYDLVGDGVVVDYRIGDMDVRERYDLERVEGVAVLRRTLELGPSQVPQRMVVLDGPERAGRGVIEVDGMRMALLQWRPEAVRPVEIERTTLGWDGLLLGGPGTGDVLDPESGAGATISVVNAFAPLHGGGDDVLARLCDGRGGANDDDPAASVWFDQHEVDGHKTDHGRFLVDLGEAVPVTRVNTYSWHRGSRSRQRYVLYGGAAGADPSAKDPQTSGWQQLAVVDTGAFGDGDKQLAAITGEGGLGEFAQLLFDVQSGGAFFQEIDVYAGKFVCELDEAGRQEQQLLVALDGAAGGSLDVEPGRVLLDVPVHDGPLRLRLSLARAGVKAMDAVSAALAKSPPVAAIADGPATPRWDTAVETVGVRGPDDGPFAVDTITIPFENPFRSRMRTAAFDFFSDGRAAVSTWNGDVWVVSGIDEDLDRLHWRRFATGLFDPMGLRIVDDVVYVHGRDGLTRLFDDDGDGEADRYECFNNQIIITPAFHEFAFDLQTDRDGNFYFSKGAPVNPGGRGFMEIAPHHGTILKVSKDGSSIEVIATGMRAPNGIAVSPDGVVTSGDNEGTYMPRCRINWIEKPGFYAGVKDTAHRTPVPDEPDLPLCWMPMEIDNSSGGQVWVTGAAWPDLQGRLLHNSYGTCSTYLVLPERVEGQMQGGVVRLPADYSSSCMRGRFSPIDGQLYTIGLKGWQTSAAREGGFHRVRRTGKPLDLPVALATCDKGVYLTFSCPVDAETGADPESYGVEIWNYRYSQNYGSPELSLLHPERSVPQGKPNRDPLPVTGATLSEDGRTVFLAIDGMRPVHQMKITWDMDTSDGRLLRGELHNSIHALRADPGFPKD